MGCILGNILGLDVGCEDGLQEFRLTKRLIITKLSNENKTTRSGNICDSNLLY